MGRGLETRIRNLFKQEKRAYYHWANGDGSDFNDVWLHLARVFKMPVRDIKAVVYPDNKPPFGGGPEGE